MGKGTRSRAKRKVEKEEANNIKEIIYIDEIELNSILAQTEKGLPTIVQDVQQIVEGSSNMIGNENTKSGKVGFSGIVGGQYQSSNTDSVTDLNQQMTQEAVSTVYNDYALQKVEENLKENGLLSQRNESNPGDVVKLNSKFSFLNFEEIKSVITNESFAQIFSQTTNLDNDPSFKTVVSMMDIIESVTHGVNLITLNGAGIFAKKESFRMNAPQLQMLQNRASKITVLGVVESIVDPSISSENVFKQQSLQNFEAISKLTATMNISLLKALKIIKNNDRLIKPIAIYFE